MAEDERQTVRAIAETLLSGSINSQRSSYTQASVTRTPDIIISEDLIAGEMQNGRMSNVRRSFCLFVTFDLLLTFLLWLICTMTAGESLESAFVNQVIHYYIKSSLFDIVMAAVCRYTVLLLFYALLRWNHWVIVSLTTATTCCFLIAKVFLFDWSKYNQPVFAVLLILTSFVLPWMEAWFFDIRVLPQETQARNWFRNFSEREPLLRPNNVDTAQYTGSEPTGYFFTPIDSPEQSGSDNDDEDAKRADASIRYPSIDTGKSPEDDHTKIDISKCYPSIDSDKLVEEDVVRLYGVVRNCFSLLASQHWHTENEMTNGDVIYYMNRSEPKGVLRKIVGVVNAPADLLINLLFDEIESSPSWNKLITKCSRIQNIDNNTDVVHQITSPHGGGLIGARDFVIVRHRMHYDKYYIITGSSMSTPMLPSPKNVVRAESIVSCCATEALRDQKKCKFTLMMHTDLKGWLPQGLVDRSTSTALSEFICYVRDYVEKRVNSRSANEKSSRRSSASSRSKKIRSK
ncbi:steroidogenic acute regulatory protein-like [Nomia melanderi]|uniref:steroidogenic acute regulatory protein-like n=1 Tax=Nomia melanderi TaxID=2448451 RepID=UPI001304370D|nr:steroidogenic acute regulatory protein-like [Nomia melanderi]XP_031827330.1 steroidogenic acute regulatory protein-like [Nomia melanderi]XP_031827331.1 steroidogenic acute regulatory protein-like [Nomia melanderi]XP_031827332.1 steroidogenic acute regulatory protein-like [Nomia melanderi]XP_031827334.1 steroidogenic acute regulatory protein-like [Nomia melanderi]XP_031827335.1 steroidogenic acute regulatory protein-like [Nomia melanderi]XP_031827336.1 steroidogenic acute regulatory protein